MRTVLPSTRVRGILAVAAVALTVFRIDAVQSAEVFYRGKTVRIVVGSAAGGTFDAEARLLARHLARHLPGEPRVMVDAVPGAGGLVAASLLSVTVPDGLTVGYFTQAPVIAQLTGDGSARFDVRRFEMIGSPYPDPTVCIFRTSSGITSLDRWRASTRPVTLGAIGRDSTTFVFSSVVATTLDLPTRIISGYRGGAEIRLAIASGELDGTCFLWGGVKNGWSSPDDLSVVVQSGVAPHRDLPDVPLAVALARRADDRELLGAPMDAIAAVARFYAAPPGVPADRRDALRDAFLRTMRDPQYIAEASASGIASDPVTGADLSTRVERLLTLPAAVVDRLRQALAR